MKRRVWLADNRAAIMKRLDWLHDQPDGLIHLKVGDSHSIVVSKSRSEIFLRLMETAKPNFSLVQSQLNLKQPFYLRPRYLQAMLLSLVWQQNPANVCMIGLGGGRIPLILHHYLPEVTIRCVENDPAMLEIASQFFGLQPDHRLTVTIGDGQIFLAQAAQLIRPIGRPAARPPEEIPLNDIILVDAFAANGRTPYHLTTKEFYLLCRRQLSAAGVVATNLLNDDPFYVEKIKTIQAVFDQVYLCRVPGGNSVVFATRAAPQLSPEELVKKAQSLQDYHQFPFPFVKRATEVSMGPALAGLLPELDQAHIFMAGSPPDDY